MLSHSKASSIFSEAVRREERRIEEREGNRERISLIPVRWRGDGREQNLSFIYFYFFVVVKNHYFEKEINKRGKRWWKEYGKRVKCHLFYYI